MLLFSRLFIFFFSAVFPVILYAGVLCVVTQRSSPSFTRRHKGAWSESGSFRFCGRMCASFCEDQVFLNARYLSHVPTQVWPPPKKVSKGLQEAKTLKRYKVIEVLAPSASHLKVIGGGGMIGRCKEVVFFALLVFIPTFPNSFLKVQS